MAKGISLEELRNNLEGDAQKEVKLLREQLNASQNTNNALESKIRHLEGTIHRIEKEEHSLFNRCYALSGQTMCQWCGLRQRCVSLKVQFGQYFDLEEATKNAEKNLLDYCNKVVAAYESEHPEVLIEVSPK